MRCRVCRIYLRDTSTAALQVGGAQSESMVFVVLVGAEDIYTLQWAEHGPASAAPIDFPGGVWTDRLAVLQARAKVCDIVPGEQPPYPSCTD